MMNTSTIPDNDQNHHDPGNHQKGRPSGKIHLTDRQIKYLAARSEGKSKKEAVLIAGYKFSSASSGVEKSPAMRLALLSAMEARGLNSEYISKKIHEGMEAKKSHFFSCDGLIKSERVVDDNETQHKYVRTALEVRGDLVREDPKMQLNVGIIEMPQKVKDRDAW